MYKKLIFPMWGISAIALFLYSFTQVDLSLTLSQVSIYQTIEKLFQYIGWFNRPLSTAIFVLIVIFMFGLYAITLNYVKNKVLDKDNVWKISLILAIILFFSYNAFSYDLFNYIFDAKILVHYHQNPYLHKALDYPGDPMLSFMHWTHRVYPYGPVWLLLTVPLYFIGFGYFLLTFYLFKLLMILSYLGSVFLVGKIAKKTGLDAGFSIAAFALNPLVLTEALVSAHNDIVMIFFGMLAVYTYLELKYVKSFTWLIISILIKYATVLIIPALFVKKFLKSEPETFFYVLTISMLFGAVLASLRTQFQPWYLLYALPFAAFIQKKHFVMIPVFIISLFALLQYVPFLYLGNWNPPVPYILSCLTYGPIALSVLIVIILGFFRPKTA